MGAGRASTCLSRVPRVCVGRCARDPVLFCACVCVCVCVWCSVDLSCCADCARGGVRSRAVEATDRRCSASRPRTVGVRRGARRPGGVACGGTGGRGTKPGARRDQTTAGATGPCWLGLSGRSPPGAGVGLSVSRASQSGCVVGFKILGSVLVSFVFHGAPARNRTETASARSEHPEVASPNRIAHATAVPGSGVGYLKGLALRAAKYTRVYWSS